MSRYPFYDKPTYARIMRRTDEINNQTKRDNNGCGSYDTARAQAYREHKYSLPVYRKL